MSKKYIFIMFFAIALAGHILFFASFSIRKPFTRTVKHPPRIEISYVAPERLELTFDKGGRKIYTKVLGVADRTFYAMPSRDGFSEKYLAPVQMTYLPVTGDEDIGAVIKRSFDDGIVREVSRLDDSYCTVRERENSLVVQRFLKEEPAAVEQGAVKKTDEAKVPLVQIDGPVASRAISSRVIPFYGKARRILDMTSAGHEAQSDNLRIKCWVDPGGIVKFAMVEKSSGASKIDGIYLKALREWRFSPRSPAGAFDTGTITFIFE